MSRVLRLADATETSAWTGVPETTLRKWVHYGWLTRHGTRRHIEYDLWEVERVMAALKRPWPKEREST